jgi:hypothetical protein
VELRDREQSMTPWTWREGRYVKSEVKQDLFCARRLVVREGKVFALDGYESSRGLASCIWIPESTLILGEINRRGMCLDWGFVCSFEGDRK